MQSSSSTLDNSADDDGLDFLRSMIAEEHVDHQQLPQLSVHQHASTITIDNMSELLRGSSGRRRSSTQDDDQDEEDDDDVDMLKGIADADDGGSLASYNMGYNNNNNPDANRPTYISATCDGLDEDHDHDNYDNDHDHDNDPHMLVSSPPSIPGGASRTPAANKDQRGPPISPMKHSRELTCSTEKMVKYAHAYANATDDVPSDNRPDLHIDHPHPDPHPHLRLPRENVTTTLQDMFEREQHADTSFMRRASSVGSNTTSQAGNVTINNPVGNEYMHCDNPLHHHSSSSVDVVDSQPHAQDGNKDETEHSSTLSDNSSTRKKTSSPKTSHPRLSNNNRRSKTYPPSSSPASVSQPQMASPSPPSQRPLAVGLPPPPPPHLIKQIQSHAFHMMAVQHLPVHIQAEAAAAAQAAVAIVAARAGVTVPSMPTPTTTARAQPPQLTPQQLQMFQQQFLQMSQSSNVSNNEPTPQEGIKIDYAAAGEAVAAAAATASKATEQRSSHHNSNEFPQVVSTNTPIAIKKKPTEKESSANVGTVMTPPTMPNTPLTATAALSSSTLDVDASSALPHYFTVSDRDDQSVSSAYSASSRGSGTVSCNSGACRGSSRRRIASSSSMSTSSGGKAKNQQPKKTPRQVKKRVGAASPKGSAGRSRQTSSSTSYRGGSLRSMQRARSYTAPGSINGSHGFGIQIPPMPMGPLSPLPSPPVGSPLPDVRSMRVTTPPRTSLTPTPSSADKPRNRASAAPLVRQHSYPVTSDSRTRSKAHTTTTPQSFHQVSTTGISPPPGSVVAATSETPSSYPSSSRATTTPATPANALLGQPPSSMPLVGGGRGVPPVPFFVPPLPVAGLPIMPAGQQATIKCWCGGSYPAGNKDAETAHAMTTQHKGWIARSQAQFYKMQNNATR